MSINFDKIKKGALKKQLKVPDNYRFTTATLTKLKGIPTGARFNFRGNDFTMSPLLKKRITFAITLMGFSRKGNKRPVVKPKRKMRG